MGDSFVRRYGPWAIVAGASRGVGAVYARELAQRGLNVILLARTEQKLVSLAQEIEHTYLVQTAVIAIDLASSELLERITESTAHLDVGLLVYNTGITNPGDFLDLSLDAHVQQLSVNCRAEISLVHYFGRRMAARGGGGMILMSSLSAFAGSPIVTAYGASKAYSLVLGEGLARELDGRGIAVEVCCAGVIADSEAVAHGGKKSLFHPPSLPPAKVVRAALNTLGKRTVVVPGTFNRVVAFFLQRMLPRSLAGRLMARTAQELDFTSHT